MALPAQERGGRERGCVAQPRWREAPEGLMEMCVDFVVEAMSDAYDRLFRSLLAGSSQGYSA
jgi:hypothetical protein